MCCGGSESITQDFATIVYRQQLLGFNAVRLPFSFQSLFDATPKTQTYQCTQVESHMMHKFGDSGSWSPLAFSL